MKDNLTLRQVFSSSSVNEESGTGPVTLHLVCSNSATTAPASPTSASSVPTASGRSAQPAPAASGPQAAGSSSRPTTTAGRPVPNPMTAFPLMMMTGATGMPGPLVWTPEQLALAQSMYQQFMSQLQANPSLLPSLTVPTTLTTGTTMPLQPSLNQMQAPVVGAPLLNNNIIANDVQNVNIINNNNNVIPNPPQVPLPAAPLQQDPVDDDDDDDPEIREERVRS